MSLKVFGVSLCVSISILSGKCQLEEGDRCVSKSDGLNGTCVSVHSCLSVIYDIKMRRKPQICSFHGTDPIVCCADCSSLKTDNSNFLVNKDGYYFPKTSKKAINKCLEYITNLDYNCTLKEGLQRERSDECYNYTISDINKTFGGGGVDAYRGEYPHMALLGYGDSLDSAQWVCGGSVISDRFILTAAHCTGHIKLGPVKFVVLGILRRSDSRDFWQRYDVKRIIPHPEYQSPSKYHDIALLEVSTKIKFSPYVLPACLQANGGFNYHAAATGWGALGRRQELANTLQVMKLTEFFAEECGAAYPTNRNLIKGYNHTTQSCYGDKEKIVDTCAGDSGGPLQVASPYGECISDIVGITSFGTPCGVLGNAGVYTRIKYYVPWIEDIVWP